MNMTTRQAAGISLWWAEGTKALRDKRWKAAMSYPVEVTNTDPQIITIFLEFLRKDIGVDEGKLRAQIQIHEGDSQPELETFWSEITDIPLEQFNKTIIRPIGNKPGKSRGTCKVRFGNKTIYLKLERMWQDIVADILARETKPSC